MRDTILVAALTSLLEIGDGVVLDCTGYTGTWVYVYRDREDGAVQIVTMAPREDLPHGTRLRIPRTPLGVAPKIPPDRRYTYHVVSAQAVSDMDGELIFSSLIPDLHLRPELWDESSPYAMSDGDIIERVND